MSSWTEWLPFTLYDGIEFHHVDCPKFAEERACARCGALFVLFVYVQWVYSNIADVNPGYLTYLD